MMKQVVASDRLSLAALMVSIFALGISILGYCQTGQHNMLSVRPHFNVTPYLEGPNRREGIYLSNEGLGPGIITNLKVTANNRVYEGLSNLWPEILPKVWVEPTCFAQGWPVPHSTIKPGDEVTLLVLTRSDIAEESCRPEVSKLLKTVDLIIEVHYKSTYEEPFTLTQPVDAFRSY